MKRFFCIGATYVVLSAALSGTANAHADLIWHWEDAFSASEQQKLETWLSQTVAAVERWAAPFPFNVHLYMHRRDGEREPVPWANTWRGSEQSIHFHVDPAYKLEDFFADWTAPHEFAHLYLPYLGRDNSWAAEGFASYLQHTLMVELGVIHPDEALRRRNEKMDRAQARLEESPEPLPDSVDRLRARRDYPSFYWGGAVFWERADVGLKEQGSSLQTVVRAFLECCRMQGHSFAELVATLDHLSASSIFSAELTVMQETPGCPDRPTPQRSES